MTGELPPFCSQNQQLSHSPRKSLAELPPDRSGFEFGVVDIDVVVLRVGLDVFDESGIGADSDDRER